MDGNPVRPCSCSSVPYYRRSHTGCQTAALFLPCSLFIDNVARPGTRALAVHTYRVSGQAGLPFGSYYAHSRGHGGGLALTEKLQ